MQTLRAYRKAHNLTQAEVASKLGVTQAMVAEIETGVTKPGAELAKRLSDMLTGSSERGSGPRGPYFGQR
jgi:transcriptional regulator with XRE-family HTH domain